MKIDHEAKIAVGAALIVLAFFNLIVACIYFWSWAFKLI
jgi:hypothetical protein